MEYCPLRATRSSLLPVDAHAVLAMHMPMTFLWKEGAGFPMSEGGCRLGMRSGRLISQGTGPKWDVVFPVVTQ
eukprot:1989274-Rhodomonas_salina.1